MLPAERRNPNVIGRDRSSGFLEFTAKHGVRDRCLLIHFEYHTNSNQVRKPALVFMLVPRMGYAKSIFTEDDHRNRSFIGANEFLDGLAFTLRDGGKRVRIENQAHSSGSTFSNSWSIN